MPGAPFSSPPSSLRPGASVTLRCCALSTNAPSPQPSGVRAVGGRKQRVFSPPSEDHSSPAQKGRVPSLKASGDRDLPFLPCPTLHTAPRILGGCGRKGWRSRKKAIGIHPSFSICHPGADQESTCAVPGSRLPWVPGCHGFCDAWNAPSLSRNRPLSEPSSCCPTILPRFHPCHAWEEQGRAHISSYPEPDTEALHFPPTLTSRPCLLLWNA